MHASGTLDLVARSGDFFVGVLYRVGVGSYLPRRESPAQIASGELGTMRMIMEDRAVHECLA